MKLKKQEKSYRAQTYDIPAASKMGFTVEINFSSSGPAYTGVESYHIDCAPTTGTFFCRGLKETWL